MKKHFLLCMITIVLLIAGSHIVQGQSILIQEQDGTIHTELISNMRNVHFASGEMILQFTGGSTNAFALANLKKVYFDTSIGVSEKTSDKLSLYPNPAGNSLHLEGIPKGNNQLTIYRTDGALILTQQVSNASHTIDLSDLNSGLYIIRVAGFTTKFIKK